MPRSSSLAVAAALLLAACARGFDVKRYQGNNERLYSASLAEFNKRKWDNAVAGFDKLTLELPARDTLLPRAYFYLGRAHAKQRDYILAAQAYTRLTESFPDDSLADKALYEAGYSYERMWRKPVLDAQYGLSAASTYRTLLSLYPNSPLRAAADEKVKRLDEWFARKDYENGMHYFRRKFYDSSIIYFTDVLKTYPDAPHARLAALRMVDAYRAIRYRDEAEETCSTLRTRYPSDAEVREACGAPRAADAAHAATTP